MMTSDVKFPDDIVQIWHYFHHQKTELSEHLVAEKWTAIEEMLSNSALANDGIPGINEKTEAMEAAVDYLSQLFSASCPGHIISFSCLFTDMKKFLARKRNPMQYEMNQILHEALLVLEKQGTISRDEKSVGKRISGKTMFILSKLDHSMEGNWYNYETNRASVPSYRTKIRAGELEKTRMIAPQDAQDLIIHLLTAFSGWIRTSDLQKAMANHIPQQFITTCIEDENGDNAIEDIAADHANSFDYESDFYAPQERMIAAETSEKIWGRICKISDKVFCLYSLPRFMGKDVKLENLGATSTVSDKNKAIGGIMREEMVDFLDLSNVSPAEQEAMRNTISKIFQKLHGRCTEKGYIMDLYQGEGN